jgi:hypothetical protein
VIAAGIIKIDDLESNVLDFELTADQFTRLERELVSLLRELSRRDFSTNTVVTVAPSIS